MSLDFGESLFTERQHPAKKIEQQLAEYQTAYKAYWDQRQPLSEFSFEASDTDNPRLSKASEARLNTLSSFAAQQISHHWNNLSPFERRVFDVAAAKQPVLYIDTNASLKPLPAEDLLLADFKGNRIAEDEYLAGQPNSNPVGKHGLHLCRFVHLAKSVYGGERISRLEDFGTGIFSLQRALWQTRAQTLPKLLARIPETNTINRASVRSYFEQVLANCRAKVLIPEAIELAVNLHVADPYTDQEWKDQLDKQLQAAPRVAAAVIEEVPEVVAVTMYGPITRKDKDYVMFHPHRGLQLGAFFSHKDYYPQAIRVAKRVGWKEGIEIQAATMHAPIYDSSVISGWFRFNPRELEHILKHLNEPGDLSSKINFLDHLHEMILQVVLAQPLAVSNEKLFNSTVEKLKQLKSQWLDPIYARVNRLHQHMENGYPNPLEYHPPKLRDIFTRKSP